jgi:hypothetical protein
MKYFIAYGLRHGCYPCFSHFPYGLRLITIQSLLSATKPAVAWRVAPSHWPIAYGLAGRAPLKNVGLGLVFFPAVFLLILNPEEPISCAGSVAQSKTLHTLTHASYQSAEL